MNLLPKGIDRNLGIFGQTGSGKSYALGLLLEELHLKTSYNIVVLDPNGDFTNFNQPLLDIEDFSRPNWKKIKSLKLILIPQSIPKLFREKDDRNKSDS
jgi:DNA helicase HerA-like ATPase